MSTIRMAVWAICLAASAGAASADTVWWEGEKPVATNFPAQTSFSASTFPGGVNPLSEGRWLSNEGPRAGDEAYARYSVEVPSAGRYRLWARKFWKHGPFRWRFDEDDWRICSRDIQLLDVAEIRRFLGVNWVYLGTVALAAGGHDFELRLLAGPGEGLTACFDAFFMTSDDTLVPGGAVKPQPAVGEPGPADWFPVVFYEDEFSEDSVIDMSHLVEAPAGGLGFLKQEGDRLRFENAEEPVQFWGCGGNYISMSREDMTQRARYLRKHGVRMVRQHPLQSAIGLLREDGTFDPERLDAWDWWFAELKKHGVYMTWSMFYAHSIQRYEGYDLFEELPGGRGGGARSTSGLVNIEPALQDSEWRWAKAILTHRNPYTGLRYVDDPALAVVEVHNEDCIFWHAPLNALETGENFPGHTARLKTRWAAWLKERYGDDDGLRAAWADGIRPGDSVDNPNMAIYGAWQMTADGPQVGEQVRQAERQRVGDLIRFLAEQQRGYYERRMSRLRSIGYKAVTITTAWRAGGPAADPANLWCDTAGDMVSRHNYFGGGVGGHNVRVGKVNNGSHLPQPGGGLLAIGMYQPEDRAFCSTEWNSNTPNQWKLEAAPLIAFYGIGLQGWDASYHFLNGRSKIGNGWPGQRSYVTDTPHYIGQFPALAFAIYKRHITPAPFAAARRLEVDELFQGVDPLSQDFTGGGYDAKELQGRLGTPAEMLAVGRVTTGFEGGRSEVVDAADYWDEGAKVIRSMTGELTWDYGRQVVTLSTPKTQAVLGRAGGRDFDLPGVEVTIATPFVSLIFTPLDDVPLVESKHILITALAQDKQTGSVYNDDGSALLQMGRPPLLLEPVQAGILLKGAPPLEVNALDPYGVPTGKSVPLGENGAFLINGTYTAYYYEVKR